MYSPTRISLTQINQCLSHGKSLPSSTGMYKSYAKNWSHTELIFSGIIMTSPAPVAAIRRGYVTARLLGLRVQIPPGVRMLFPCECCVLCR
jgi:hypothetical protein